VSGRFRRINSVVHDLADLMCKLDEEPELELQILRELRPLAFKLLLLTFFGR
jgi:hypothetical protein